MNLIRSFFCRRRLTTVLLCLFAFDAALAFSAAAADDATDTTNTTGAEEEDERTKLYVEYALGVSITPNQTLQSAGATNPDLWGRTESDPGVYLGGAVGTEFLENFRAELRIDYRTSEVDNLTVRGYNENSDGDLRLLSIMANGYFDLDLDSPVTPWIGAGIGWGRIELDAENEPTPDGSGDPPGDPIPAGSEFGVDDTDSVFVYNVMVGATYEISKIADLSAGYRYVATEDVRLNGKVDETMSQRVDYEYDAHELFVGLRFNF